MSRQLTIRILSVLLLAVITTYIVMSIEVFDAERELSTSPEVRENEYLAMQSLLERVDTQVIIEDDYRRLFSKNTNAIEPIISDGLVLTEAEAAVPASLAKRILEWVDDGGFLVVSMSSSRKDSGSHRGNELLKALGASVEWLEWEEDSKDEEKEDEAESDAETSESEDDEYEAPITYMSDPYDHPIEITLETDYRITLEDDTGVSYTVGNEYGDVFIQIDRGEGLITLMTETYIWDNTQIEDRDNAILMVGLFENSDTVYVINPKELPHWTVLLRDYSPLFVAVFGLLICLTIWHLSKRFGGVINTDEEQQSRFSDHIKVAGDYYWEQDKQEQMILDVRGIIFLKIHQKWPSIKSTEHDKIITVVAELSGFQASLVEQLLFSQNKLNQSQFTQSMKGLQQLRKIL